MIGDYVIWSFEHSAWWAPLCRGYTPDLAEAGRYTAEQAGQICCDSIMGYEVALYYQTALLNGKPTVKGLWA